MTVYGRIDMALLTLFGLGHEPKAVNVELACVGATSQ